jgi:hypothetical protein
MFERTGRLRMMMFTLNTFSLYSLPTFYFIAIASAKEQQREL